MPSLISAGCCEEEYEADSQWMWVLFPSSITSQNRRKCNPVGAFSPECLVTWGVSIHLAVAFCCGIPNISDQIKVAENTRDLSGLVGGGAGVKRSRPQELERGKI
ncbi:hypothetical protein H8959_022663 [Pygathrix nigripes]